jgi:TatD DNase family protein
MNLIDTHAHLDDEKFRSDLQAVLDRARAVGVTHIVAVATTGTSSATCVALAERNAMVRATVGMQPNNIAQAASDDWDKVVALSRRPEVVALGETGLDRYWDYTPFAQQEDYFARHLNLAREVNRPVVIHCRQAEADTIRMLRADFDKNGPVRAVMHSFTGDWPTAQACLAMGLFISFAGMVTYKNAQALRDVAEKVPLNRLLVETDCPYLAPVPVRGQRNEPAFVQHTALCLAAVKGLPLETIAETTTQNARTLFGNF